MKKLSGGNLSDCLPSTETIIIVGKNIFVLIFFIVIGFLIFTYFSAKNYSNIIENKQTIHYFKESIKSNDLIANSEFKDPVSGYCMSITLKINDFYTNSEKWRHIFHKGSSIDNSNDINYMNFNSTGDNTQYPGLWIYPNTNNFKLCLTTTHNESEYFNMYNMPLGKFFVLSFNISEKICEVYMNGKLTDTFICKHNIQYNSGNAYFLYNNSSPWGEIKHFRYIPNFLDAKVFPFIHLIDNN